MTRLLIALAALLIFGAQLTAPVQAQGSWTCNWSFAASGLPSGWSVGNGSVTAGGIFSSYDTGWGAYSASVIWPSSVTMESASVTFQTGAESHNWFVGGNLLTTTNNNSVSSITISGSGSATGGSFWVEISKPRQAYIVSANMTGTGTNPCPATPTPTTAPPTATGTSIPPTATPEVWVVNTYLTPTPIAIDASGLYEALQRGNDNLLGLPPDLNTSSLPQEDGRQVFAYVKWLISPSSADEIAGPFAPIISHTGIFLSLTFFLAVVYAVVWVSVFLFKFVVWIFKLILLIVDLVLQVAQAVGQFIGGIVKFLLGG